MNFYMKQKENYLVRFTSEPNFLQLCTADYVPFSFREETQATSLLV